MRLSLLFFTFVILGLALSSVAHGRSVNPVWLAKRISEQFSYIMDNDHEIEEEYYATLSPAGRAPTFEENKVIVEEFLKQEVPEKTEQKQEEISVQEKSTPEPPKISATKPNSPAVMPKKQQVLEEEEENKTLQVSNLSSTGFEYFQNVPADQLPTGNVSIRPKDDVSIERSESNNPFPEIDEESIDPTVGVDVGLKVEVKEIDTSSYEFLQIAYEALQSGQLESAAAYYRQVIQKEPENIEALFGLATTYHRSGQIEEAKEYYIQCISLNNKHWPALNNFLILASQEAPSEALRQLKELEKSNPEFAAIPAHIGLINVKQGRFKEASSNMTRAVMLDPENLHYRYTLAVILDRQGSENMAARLYQQILSEGRKGKELPESADEIRNRLGFIEARRIEG